MLYLNWKTLFVSVQQSGIINVKRENIIVIPSNIKKSN